MAMKKVVSVSTSCLLLDGIFYDRFVFLSPALSSCRKTSTITKKLVHLFFYHLSPVL